MRRTYFVAYNSNKAAARVRPYLFPGTHHFAKKTTPGPVKIYSERQSQLTTTYFEELMIYHYPSCGFDQFLNKYKLLSGTFRNDLKFRGTYPKNSLHLLALAALKAGDFYKLNQLYRNRVLFPDYDQAKKLIKAGIFFEDKSISRLIRRLLEKADADRAIDFTHK